jgi:poly-gamma-glutamate synthesis protein (capsule biosynthesis protein)
MVRLRSRRLLGGVFALVVSAALACGGGGSEEPAPAIVRLWAEPELAGRALAQANELLAPRGLTAAPALAEQADLAVSSSLDDASGAPFATRYWVPVVQLPHGARDVPAVWLGDAIAGRATDWSAVIGGEAPLRVVVPLDPAPPIAQWWPEVQIAADAVPLEAIPGALVAEPGTLALVPLDAVTVGMRSLAVDGVNIVFGAGDARSYALTERAWIAGRDGADEALAAQLGDVVPELAERLALPPPDPIILRATGDILPVRCTYERLAALGDYRLAFEELGPWLAEADLTVGSLDAAISDAGVPFGCVETFSLMGPAAAADGLAVAGFDVITVATNHVKDCGQSACGDQAFFDTLANLRSIGVAPVGGGADLAEARAPAVLEVQGVRFAFLGYDEIAPYYHAGPGVAGTAPLIEAHLREDSAAAAALADVVVVLPQWGVEYTADPTLQQQALARAAVEAGADLVIGNHPHWVQAAGLIDEAFVAYALGNFLFDQDWSIETQQGVVLEAAFHGARLKGVEYYPIRILDEYRPVFAEPAEAQQILDRIWTASLSLQE